MDDQDCQVLEGGVFIVQMSSWQAVVLWGTDKHQRHHNDFWRPIRQMWLGVSRWEMCRRCDLTLISFCSLLAVQVLASSDFVAVIASSPFTGRV
jgi:hypothetical protein